MKKFCDYHQGMVLVTGSTGTGKSTTLAAMIDHLNRTRRLNIISLEDPIEFVHRSKQSQVIQRELHTHLPSFAEGVRAAMREDPDVILVGELRDADTVRWAMTAAETGHLVLGTLHTTSAVKTIDRMVDALPAEEREQTKSFLSQSLIGVVTQVLVRTPDLRGRRAVCEVMVMNRAIGKLIMTDQTHMIPSAAADRQGVRHADAWTRRCSRRSRRGRSIRRTPSSTRRTSGRSRATSRTGPRSSRPTSPRVCREQRSNPARGDGDRDRGGGDAPARPRSSRLRVASTSSCATS